MRGSPPHRVRHCDHGRYHQRCHQYVVDVPVIALDEEVDDEVEVAVVVATLDVVVVDDPTTVVLDERRMRPCW